MRRNTIFAATIALATSASALAYAQGETDDTVKQPQATQQTEETAAPTAEGEPKPEAAAEPATEQASQPAAEPAPTEESAPAAAEAAPTEEPASAATQTAPAEAQPTDAQPVEETVTNEQPKEPAAQTETSEQPAKEQPAAEQQATDAPATETPAAAENTAPATEQQPATQQQATDAPATKAPASDSTAAQQPAASEPQTQTTTQPAQQAAPAEGGQAQQPATDQPAATAADPVQTDAPPVVVNEQQTEAEKAAAAQAEQQRRAEKRKRRRELIGAGVAGVAVGAVLQGVLGGKVVEDEGDRIVVERDGRYYVRKDENVLLRRNGVEVITEELDEGRQRTTAIRPNGVEIVTLRDRNGNILKRTKRFPNGDEVVLIDNQDFDIYADPQPIRLKPLELAIERDAYVVEATRADRRRLRETLLADPVEQVERDYSLREVRDNARLRAKVRRIDLDSINFTTGSATVTRSQIAKLDELGNTLAAIIENDPDEVFLIEGHTDAVGSDLSNLTLSDRRAETVARILIENYGVPPENLITEGYGEQDLKVDTPDANAANRRVTVRRITPLLRTAAVD